MIPVFKPSIKRKDMDSVLTCMVSEMLGPGPVLKLLNERTAEYFGCQGTLILSSYYFALATALDVLELQQGDGVVVSALSPNMYLRVIRDRGLVPIIVDVDPDSGSIPVAEIENVIAKGAKAIILHYSLCFFPDIEAILQLNIPVIEDISHCSGAKKGETFYGNFGLVTVASLEQESIFTTCAGGLVFSNDKKIVKTLKSLQDSLPNDFFLSDFNASLGVMQLKEINHFIERRREIFAIHQSACMKSRNKTLVQKFDENVPFFSFPVILTSSMNEVRKYARKHDIDTSPAFIDSVISKNIDLEEQFPNAKNILLRCLLFPLYPMLSGSHVDQIVKVLATLP